MIVHVRMGVNEGHVFVATLTPMVQSKRDEWLEEKDQAKAEAAASRQKRLDQRREEAERRVENKRLREELGDMELRVCRS